MSYTSDSIFERADGISDLFPDDFDDRGRLIKRKYQKGLTIVMIYAPWCGHCHHTKPELVRVSKILDHDKIRVMGINGVEHRDLVARLERQIPGFQVDGFPTIIKFKGDKYRSTYSGPRNRNALFQFIIDP